MAKIARIWNGSEWIELSTSIVNYPDQTGNANKVLTTDGSIVSWENPPTGTTSDSFKTLSTPNGTSPVADSPTDTLTLTESNGVIVTGDSSTDTINISTNATSLNTASTIISRASDQSFDITAVDFDTTDTISSAVGRLNWNDGDGTLSLGLKGGNINIPIGQEEVALCYNGTGSTLSKGTVVYINGAQGQRPTIAKSNASSESTSSKTFGIVSESIANGAEGFVTTFGIIRGLNTSSFTEGSALWLSTTDGLFTQTPPSSPNHSVFIGYCVKSHASSGEVFVNIQNGYELQELHNVSISSVQDNHILSYDSAQLVWKNQGLASAIQEVDGAGSNIDADLLDGEQGTYYLNTSSTAQTKAGDLTITGNLTVNGTTTTINSTIVTVDDKNIELGSVDTPTNITADGGGITLKGDTDKHLNWIAATASWTSSENIDLLSGKVIKFGGTDVLSATNYIGNAATVTNGVYTTGTYVNPSWISQLEWSKITSTPTSLLGYGITDIGAAKTYLSLQNVENTALSTWSGSINITTLGTISSGTWNASIISETYLDASLARVNSPTFSGTVVLPGTTSIGNVTNLEISYLDGVTSSIQTQLNNKLDSSTASSTYAPIASPTFTGTVNFASATVTGIDLLPSQTGNSGKYLTTNGTAASWAGVAGSVYSNDAPASPSVGQIWVEADVDVSSFDPRIFVRWNRVLSSSQSTFSGVGSNGVVLEYTPGFEQVYLNGVLLLRSTDYTASDGSTIVLSSNAVSGDVVEVVAQNVTSVANTYSQTQVDSALALKANLASPTFTGVPTAPTATLGTNNTQISTTSFVYATIDNEELLIIAGAL